MINTVCKEPGIFIIPYIFDAAKNIHACTSYSAYVIGGLLYMILEHVPESLSQVSLCGCAESRAKRRMACVMVRPWWQKKLSLSWSLLWWVVVMVVVLMCGLLIPRFTREKDSAIYLFRFFRKFAKILPSICFTIFCQVSGPSSFGSDVALQHTFPCEA